jgi:hypothetical protein
MKTASIEIHHTDIHSGITYHCANGYSVSIQKGAIAGVNMASDDTSEIGILHDNYGIGEPQFCIIPSHEVDGEMVAGPLGHVKDEIIPDIILAVQTEAFDILSDLLDIPGDKLIDPPHITDPWDAKEAAEKSFG